jgi:gliding motility-associated-like protein
MPIFEQLGPLAQNSTPPVLPKTSVNGITGIWAPAKINTANVGFVNYIFFPNEGQCAAETNMRIEIVKITTPTFNKLGPFCQYSDTPALPDLSLEGITGAWDPAQINTSNTGSTIYTFKPNEGQNARSTTISIQVNPNLPPIFDPVPPVCIGSTIAPLPTVSRNGITGSWSPQPNSNQTTTYTFIYNPNQCATRAELTIEVLPIVTPDFDTPDPVCEGGTMTALPVKSKNNITGSWSPALNNQVTTTYTFRPAGGQCAVETTTSIQIKSNIVPAFKPIGPLCQDDVPPALLTVSADGYPGIWSPAVISTALEGNATYSFTPDSAECVIEASMDIFTGPYPQVDLGNDTALCYPNVLSLDAGNYGESYLWSTGYHERVYKAHEGAGTVWVKVTNAYGCTTTDTIVVKPCIVLDYLLIPNAFTPNDDGDNDIWRIGGIQFYPNMIVSIYDRWGQLLFHSEPGYPKPWEGRYKDRLLPLEAYFYIIDLGDGSKPRRGSVTLIR